ncbi:MAG: hypothetical protein OEZ51_10065 [Nitrospinota bacterium]|nr:hypothetical protein [Nitrospinota bacterium]
MNSQIKDSTQNRSGKSLIASHLPEIELLTTQLLSQEPSGFILRSLYGNLENKRDLASKFTRIIENSNPSKEGELVASLLSITSRLPRNAKIINNEKVIQILGELQKEKIEKRLDPTQKTVSVYYPDGAYREQTGNLLNKLRSTSLNTLTFIGTICNDAHENAENVFYGGHGIIELMDFVDLFICSTYAHNFPGNSKKVYLMHDIHDSPVSKEEEILKRKLDFDYYFLPSPVVMDRVKTQIHQTRALGYVKEDKEICLIPGGYPKLDQNLRWFEKHQTEENIIIHAPTVTDSDVEPYACLPRHSEIIIEALLENFPEYKIIFRPHPHTVQSDPVARIVKKHRDNPRFIFDNNASFYMANYAKSALMVTDFSGTAFTYAFTTLRPVVFFSHNEANFKEVFGDFKFIEDRNKIGMVAQNIDELTQNIKSLLAATHQTKSQIKEYRDSLIYNVQYSENYFIDNLPNLLNNDRREDWTYLQVNSLPPQLFQEGYKGFNIVKFKNKFFALSQELGDVDLEKASLSEVEMGSKCFVGTSTTEVKGYVDWMIHSSELIRESQEKSLEIGKLQGKLSRQASREKDLSKELQEKISLLEQLMTEVDRLDDRVNTLSADNQKYKKSTEALQQELIKRNIRIESLLKDSANYKARIETLTNAVELKNIKIESLLIATREKDLSLDTLEQEIQKRDSRTRHLVNENEEKNSKIETLLDEMEDRKTQMEVWMGEATDKKHKVNTLMAQMEEKTSKSKALARELELRDKWLKLLRDKFKTTADHNQEISMELEKLKSSFLYRLFK